jgi:hypothetical protein
MVIILPATSISLLCDLIGRPHLGEGDLNVSLPDLVRDIKVLLVLSLVF